MFEEKKCLTSDSDTLQKNESWKRYQITMRLSAGGQVQVQKPLRNFLRSSYLISRETLLRKSQCHLPYRSLVSSEDGHSNSTLRPCFDFRLNSADQVPNLNHRVCKGKRETADLGHRPKPSTKNYLQCKPLYKLLQQDAPFSIN